MDLRHPTGLEEAPGDSPPDDWYGRTWRAGPSRRYPRWPFVLGGLLLALGIAIAALSNVSMPYFALAPGPVNDVTGYVEVEDPAEERGDLFFLTVTLKEVSLFEYLAARLNDEVDLSPRETIRPSGVTPEELRSQNLALMDQSKQNAIFVALSELGYEVTFEGSGALITGIVDGTAADGVLMTDDLIVAVNGEPVEFQNDAIDLLRGFRPGDAVTLSIDRPADGEEFERLEFTIILTPFRAEEEDGTIVEDENRGMVGVLLGNGPTNIIFPIEVEIDSQNIGGPSAGMMFTLEIMNQLTSDDLTRGHRIAGTGTIDQDGVVGAIGGVRQKVFGAIDAGAEYVLVPEANFVDAADAADDDITVVQIDTIDDALAFFDALPVL